MVWLVCVILYVRSDWIINYNYNKKYNNVEVDRGLQYYKLLNIV